MKAIVNTKYGSPDVLQLKEVARPIPKHDEVLVKVRAASLNAADFENLRGVFIVRMVAPLRPMHRILGSDIAGQVEAVGGGVKGFQSGDDVYGDLSVCGFGAFAEYACVPESALALKPSSMTFEQAATYPQAGVLALQNLGCAGLSSSNSIFMEKDPVKPGQKVLINGAGGGVGTFAVQIAKHFGAEVTGVDRAEKLNMLRSIGADHVMDYKQEDFTKSGGQYDLILDPVAYRSIFAHRRALSSNGVFVYVGGSTSAVFQSLLLGPMISKNRSQKLGVMVQEPNNKENLNFLAALFENGKVKPVIDRRYPLRELPEALRYLEEGHALGKVVITVEHNSKT